VNQILRAAGVEVEGTSPLSATTAASVQSSPSNGGATVTSQAPEADGASTSKPARGRTSRGAVHGQGAPGGFVAGPCRGERKWGRASS